jgi:hypothetical protein
LERQFVEERAAEKASKRSEQEISDLRARQRSLELAPKVEKAVEQFRTVVTSGELKLPEGITPMASEVAEVIKTKGFEAARKQFPVEAPIYMGIVQVGEEYLRVVNNLVPWDPANNPTHAWLDKFIDGQERFLMQNETARVVDGRKFVPGGEYARLPADELNKHWTLSDKDILEMIAGNGHIQAHHKLKELTDAGFVRPAKEVKPAKDATTPVAAQPPAAAASAATTPTTASPLAGVTAMPGASTAAPQKNPNASCLDALMPGTSQRL